jgi:hypothetical protein
LEVREERRWMPVYACDDPARFHARPNLSIVGEAGTDGDPATEVDRAEDDGPSRR